MRKILSLAVGLNIGALIGFALVMILAPATGSKLRGYLREGFRDAMDEARTASQKRQLELAIDLQQRQKRGVGERPDQPDPRRLNERI